MLIRGFRNLTQILSAHITRFKRSCSARTGELGVGVFYFLARAGGGCGEIELFAILFIFPPTVTAKYVHIYIYIWTDINSDLILCEKACKCKYAKV